MSKIDVAAVLSQYRIEDYIGKLTTLSRAGNDRRGDCPFCGSGKKTATKFSVNVRKQSFKCFHCSKHGDLIQFIRDFENCSFVEAVERLGGEPELSVEDRRRIAEKRAADAKAEEAYRLNEIKKARRTYDQAEKNTYALLKYFRSRGINIGYDYVHQMYIRFHVNLPYYHIDKNDNPYVLFNGPAMVAPITEYKAASDTYEFIGAHITWLKDDLSGKRHIELPDGEVLNSKKIKGCQNYGYIQLFLPEYSNGLFQHWLIGEGIETTLSGLWVSLEQGHVYGAVCGVSLGNMAGVGEGVQPDLSVPGIQLPYYAEKITLLGDGDSDRATTEQALCRAAARFVADSKRVFITWADNGQDFNDML